MTVSLLVSHSTFVSRATVTTVVTIILIRTRTVRFSSADKITEAKNMKYTV